MRYIEFDELDFDEGEEKIYHTGRRLLLRPALWKKSHEMVFKHLQEDDMNPKIVDIPWYRLFYRYIKGDVK